MGRKNQRLGTGVVGVPHQLPWMAWLNARIMRTTGSTAKSDLPQRHRARRAHGAKREKRSEDEVSRKAKGQDLDEDEAPADAEGYGFGAGGGAEFAEDSGYVEFGGVVGDVQAGGDFLVGEPGG